MRLIRTLELSSSRIPAFGVRALLILATLVLSSAPVLGVSYYVNDGSRTGDVYCEAAGNAANDGLSPGSPLLSLVEVLSRYRLGGGDFVFVDTGTYLNHGATFTTNDCGSASNGYLTIQGSTNWLAGGTVLDRGYQHSGAAAIYINDADYVRLKDLTVRGGESGVSLYQASNIECDGVLARNNRINGFRLNYTTAILLKHCVAAWNSTGMSIDRYSVTCEGCVFWKNSLAGLWVYVDAAVTVRDSVFRQTAGSAYGRDIERITGDYNVFDCSGSGAVAQNNTEYGRIYTTLSEYQAGYKGDLHSTAMDAGLADGDNLDFHPKSEGGRYDPSAGTWTTDAVTSVLVDFGDPGAVYTNELEPNGARINVGTYGDTGEASKGHTNAWLLALAYNDGGHLSGTNNVLYWTGGGLTNGATVTLEYSADLGATWVQIASGVTATNQQYVWDVEGLGDLSVMWRVVNESDTNVWDANEQRVSVNDGLVLYYANDNSTNGDVYCTAVGASTNTGLTADSPLGSLAQVLSKYTLGGGDFVYVDTGIYSNHAAYIGANDCGSISNGYLTIQGSTNWLAGGTVLDRGYQYSSAAAIYINDADYVRLKDLTVRGGEHGVYCWQASNIECDGVLARNNRSAGFRLIYTTAILLKHCVAAWNSTGMSIDRYSVTCEGCVFWKNSLAGLWVYVDAAVTVRDSVFRQTAGSAYGRDIERITGDYNVFDCNGSGAVAQNDGASGPIYMLSEYQAGYGKDLHSTVMDAGLADGDNLDFHPKSEAGRWTTTGWVTDAVTSVVVDFGDPGAVYTNELEPNGSRINAGIYGNTDHASRSPTNPVLFALTYNDGGELSVPSSTIRWHALGFSTDDTVRVDLSLDGGLTWAVAESNLFAVAGEYAWRNVDFGESTDAFWRVVSEANTNVYDTNDGVFHYRNDFSLYYINDSSVFGDVFSTAIGNDANSGLVPSEPMASLQALLDLYDLKRGDRVYVDTGIYELSQDVVIGAEDGADNTFSLTIQGSTNELWPATFVGGGIVLSSVESVVLKDLNLQGGQTGVRILNSTNCVSEFVRSHHHVGHGFIISNSIGTVLSRSVSMKNGLAGLLAASSVDIDSSILWMNAGSGIRFSGAALNISNSVIGVSGTNVYAYYLASGSVDGDYNNIYREGGANVAYIASNAQECVYLMDWVSAMGADRNSLTHYPHFADAGAGDFHLRTVRNAGRYIPGYGWTNDYASSPMIDAGDPLDGGAGETEPNGGRKNIGLYGGTEEASRSDANGWLLAVNLNDGGQAESSQPLSWIVGGAVTNSLVSVKYSPDLGASWTNIATGIQSGLGSHVWDSTGYASSTQALWRVESEDDPNIRDDCDAVFDL